MGLLDTISKAAFELSDAFLPADERARNQFSRDQILQNKSAREQKIRQREAWGLLADILFPEEQGPIPAELIAGPTGAPTLPPTEQLTTPDQNRSSQNIPTNAGPPRISSGRSGSPTGPSQSGGLLGFLAGGGKRKTFELLSDIIPNELGRALTQGLFAPQPNTSRALTGAEEINLFGADKDGTFFGMFDRQGNLVGVPELIKGTTTPTSPGSVNMVLEGPDGKRIIKNVIKGSPDEAALRDLGFILGTAVSTADNQPNPPSGFRFTDNNTLEAIPGGPGDISQKNLNNSISRGVAATAAPLFGGIWNPVSGGTSFGKEAGKDVQLDYLKVQARAIEILQDGEATSIPDAVQKAFNEIQGGIPTPPAASSRGTTSPDSTKPDRTTIIADAKSAILRGANRADVEARLRAEGIDPSVLDQ